MGHFSFQKKLNPLFKITILFFFILICFFGCSNVNPELISSYGIMVFDYSLKSELPQSRLCAFVLLSSSSRFSSLTISKSDEDLSWVIQPGESYKAINGTYVGSSYLLPPSGKIFSNGSYLLQYKDVSSKTIDSLIKIQCPQDISTIPFTELTNENFNFFPNKRIVVYDVNGNILYFGAENKNLWNKVALKELYPSAFSFRFFYGDTNLSCAILAPPELLGVGDLNE